MSEIQKLQFNGRTILNPNRNAYVGFIEPEQIYYVTCSGSNGTVTATPNQGPNGTTVTLSNTPNTNYQFDSYTLTGATLKNTNQFDINNSDVTVVGNFSLKMQQYVNLGSTEYRRAGTSTSTVWYAFTGMPSSSSFNYFTYIFDAYLASGGGGAADIYLGNSSNSIIWRMRAHYQATYPGFVGIQSNVTAYSIASGSPSQSTTKLNNATYYCCSSKWPKSTYSRFKLVFNRNAKTCLVYIGGSLLGTATLNTDPINITKFGLMSEQARSYEIAAMKNIKVAGFKNLTDAQNWS